MNIHAFKNAPPCIYISDFSRHMGFPCAWGLFCMAHFHTGWFQNVLLCSSWDSLTPTLGLSGKLARSII